jgi:serine/threonine protein kinase
VSLKKLGRYDLVRVLGKGAMGIVYEGRDPNLERRVAIKTVKVENLSEEAAAEYESRFRTEARSAARLQHPNIVSVYDSDRDGDIAFLVMEYIQGDDLKHHLDKGIRYSLEQSLKMIRDLLSALDYAHKQNIIHRDVKPANLLIEPGGRVKLTDFGVARIQDSGEATRTQGSMVGTLKYMSPEQVQGQKIDSRADLFSVGVVLYQLLTDKRPFDGDNDFSIIHQIIGHTPAPPSTHNARLPSAIDAVVARALAKDRDQRFATARDFATALQSAIRRAEDQTVVPPADPFKKSDGPGTGSRGHQSMAGGLGGPTSPGSGSTVTQELELVYWKDIKDSTDAEELEGFLDKFPAGIYADLARRRLRKLKGGSSPDQTMLSGMQVHTADQDLEATRVRTATTPLMEPSGVVGPPAADPTETLPAMLVTPPATVALDADSAMVQTHDVPTENAAGGDTERQDPPKRVLPPTAPAGHTGPAGPKAITAPPPAKVPASHRPKSRMAVLAGIGALAAVGIAAFMMKGQTTTDPSLANPSSTASPVTQSAPVSDVVLTTAGVPTAVTVSSPAAFAASALAVKASAPRRVSSAPRMVKAPASVPAAEVAKAAAPAPAPVSHKEEVRTAATPALPVATASLVDSCKDKVFLSKEFCLAEHCDKPGARSHALCVQRREEAKLREESRVRN